MDVTFLKTRIHICYHGLVFPNSVRFECYFEWFLVYIHLRAFFESLWFLFQVICPFGLSAIFFMFPYFTLKLFCFLWIRLLVCPRVFSAYLLVEFFLLLFWKILFWFYLLILFQYLLSLPSFVNIFGFISLCCIIRLACCFVLIFSFQIIPVFFPSLTSSLVVIISYLSFWLHFSSRFCIFA